MPLRAENIEDLDSVARACRMDRHMWPDTRKVEYVWTKANGRVVEAEIQSECERGCGVVMRRIFEVSPGPVFHSKGTRYTYPDDRPYLLAKGQGHAVAPGVVRGMDAKERYPSLRWG